MQQQGTNSPFSCALIIFNPAANHGKAAALQPAVRNLFDGHIDHELAVTDAPWHAHALARKAVRDGFPLIIAAGGDGTSHEVANGIIAETGRVPVGGSGEEAGRARAALAVLPLGSGNDYARTLGMPRNLRKAADQILRGKTKLVDAGICNGTIFTNSVGIGLDGRVSHRAAELKEDSSLTGFPLYFAALMYVLRHEFGGHRARITLGDGPAENRDFLMMAVTHGPTYGSGFRITPQAVNGDGLFDYCIVDDLSLPDALWRIPFVVAGKHNVMEPVTTGRASRISVEANEEIFAQLDGEPYRARRFELTVLPRVLAAVIGDGRVA